MSDPQTIKRLVYRDADDVPLPALEAMSSRLKPRGLQNRLPQIEVMLLQQPGDTRATELYLHEFLNRTIKQMGGDLQLGPTFKEAVKSLGDEY